MTGSFHRLLGYFSERNPRDSQTIRFRDSLTGNLALGYDFPVALSVALGRHLWFRKTGLLSLAIHVPSVRRRAVRMDGLAVDKKEYSCSEILTLAGKNGRLGQLEALGLWILASDVYTGKLSGQDILSFQEGTLLHKIKARRRDTDQILPLWRGGPISSRGHSWAVKKFFDVDVYQANGGSKTD